VVKRVRVKTAAGVVQEFNDVRIVGLSVPRERLRRVSETDAGATSNGEWSD